MVKWLTRTVAFLSLCIAQSPSALECTHAWHDVELRSHCCDTRYQDGPSDCISSRGRSFLKCCYNGSADGFVGLTDEIQQAGFLDFNLVSFLTAPPFHPNIIELFPFVCSPLREGRFDRQCDILAFKWFNQHTRVGAGVPNPSVCDEAGRNAEHGGPDIIDFCTSMYLRRWQHSVWRSDNHRGGLSRSKCSYALQLLYFSQASSLAMALDSVAQSRRQMPRSGLSSYAFYWWREQRARRCAVAEQRAFRQPRSFPPPSGNAKAVPQAGRVGLILSVPYNTEESPLTRAAVGMWRCYATRHGYEVIVDTEEYDGYDALHTVRYPRAVWPLQFVIGASGEPREVSLAQPASVGWIKWRAARRWLAHFDAVIVADAADMVVSFACYDIPLHQFVEGADVVLRDVPDRTELNGGLAIIRNSPNGRHFLDCLLGHASVYGLPFADQDALALTVLHYVSDEVSQRLPESRPSDRSEVSALYASVCFSEVLPFRSLFYSVADLTYCILTELERLVGTFGSRRSKSIKFVDPREVDINFKTSRADLNTTGFVLHFAGMSRKYETMQNYLRRYNNFDLQVFQENSWHEVCEHLILGGQFEECTPVGFTDPDCQATICG